MWNRQSKSSDDISESAMAYKAVDIVTGLSCCAENFFPQALA